MTQITALHMTSLLSGGRSVNISHWFTDSELEDVAASFKVVGCGVSSAYGVERFVKTNARKTLLKATQPIFIKLSPDIYEAV